MFCVASPGGKSSMFPLKTLHSSCSLTFNLQQLSLCVCPHYKAVFYGRWMLKRNAGRAATCCDLPLLQIRSDVQDTGEARESLFWIRRQRGEKHSQQIKCKCCSFKNQTEAEQDARVTEQKQCVQNMIVYYFYVLISLKKVTFNWFIGFFIDKCEWCSVLRRSLRLRSLSSPHLHVSCRPHVAETWNCRRVST